MDLGEQKPSQLLRRMRVLARDKISDDTLRVLWQGHLPNTVRAVLAVTETKDLDSLAIRTLQLLPLLYRGRYTKKTKDIIRECRDDIISKPDPKRIDLRELLRTNEEIRHASKAIVISKKCQARDMFRWGRELMTKRWYVDKTILSDDHPLRDHIIGETWPTPKQVIDFGDHWHELPSIKCFDVLDILDPSIIYADKSHSMDGTEVLDQVPRTPIDRSRLAKAKKREIKPDGRFYSLMSWEMREYFVVTEYLIKTHFVPLFRGLTMADDLNTVIKKLMDNSSGQGNADYGHIRLANHVDYTKWNNHQRHEANFPVFQVMDKFLGFNHPISRTHEIFQSSLVYYNGRPDLMTVTNGTLQNRGADTADAGCWDGQRGGLEGLRQKGWNVVNLLVIRRESFNRNTKVTLLAQGDNQVICTKFKLQKNKDEVERKEAIVGIVRENQNIMTAIELGTTKLELIINKDETLQSADYLVYGKVLIFRGSIRGLEAKRWSRVTCVTNDQLPILANTMSNISSNALTVAHFSTSPVNAMVHYNYLGNFARNLLDLHNPAIKSRRGHQCNVNISIYMGSYTCIPLS
ncbi:hypothetical protein ACJJTC_012961 [Scirpophaga incertulas]